MGEEGIRGKRSKRKKQLIMEEEERKVAKHEKGYEEARKGERGRRKEGKDHIKTTYQP